MKVLKIIWKRLVSEGETCPRCSGTEEELGKAVFSLKESLSPLGLDVVFEKKELSVEEFKESPLKSNIIIINDKSLENWINGEVGESQCCDVCGTNDCRTTTVGGRTYEKIPSELVIKAGLIAASNMVGSEESGPCCNEKSSVISNNSCC